MVGPTVAAAETELTSEGPVERLAVGEVHLYTDGDDAPVAIASGSYALPRSLR